MPNIHVTCPKCRTELELDAEHEGQEIECGSCLAVFVATADAPTSRRGSASDSGSGRSRRRDDDEDDRPRRRRDERGDDYDERPRRREAQNGLAVTSLVTGLISVALIVIMFPIVCVGGCCCPPAAWLPLPVTVPVALTAVVTGALGVKRPEGKGMAITGIVLGSLALAIAVLQLAFGFLPFLAMPPPQAR